MRTASGIPGFDALVQGGFPKGAAVVVQGPAGREKDAFLFQFVVEGLRQGGAALIVLSSVSPATFQNDLRAFGIDVDAAIAENRLKFVDWHSYKEEAVQDVQADGPTFKASIDLANVGIAISRAIASLPRDKELRAAVELLSPALSVYELQNVYGFAQSTKAKLERFGFTSLFVVEKDMHDERTISSIHQPFDGVVDIERVREGDELVRKLAVLSLKATTAESKYVPLEVGPDHLLRVAAVSERERTLRKQEDLIRTNPKDPKIWLATARNLSGMGEHERALKCVEAALNLDPADATAWRLKADVLDALGRHDEAAKARQLATTPPPAPIQKDDVAARLTSVVDQRLAQNPRDADALFVKAATLAKVEDLAGAIGALETLVAVDDAYPGLWVLKAKLHARRGEREKAQGARLRAQEIERRQERLAQEREARRAPPPAQTTFECPKCDASVREEDTVCPSCGVFFEGVEEPPKPRDLPPPKPKPELAKRGLTNGLAREMPRGAGRTNGLVNGLRGRTNGLVNGTKGRTNGLVNGTRGRTNGLVNGTKGRTNGLVNGTKGRTNGLVNGTKGRTNGLVNGTKGRTNGLVNGTRGRTNGLVNGLVSLRTGMTNGLTNGSGFTNGLGSSRLRRENQVKRWKLYLIPVLSAAMLLLPLLGPTGPSGAGGPITIDGAFADWSGVSLATSGTGGVPTNVDLVRAGVADNVDFLAFYFEVAGTALAGGGSPATTDAFRAFLDVDRDPGTGYRIEGLGADRLLEVTGYGGAVVSNTLWEWDTARSQLDWNGWIKAATVPASAVGGNRVEAQVDWATLAPQKLPIDVVFHATSFDGSTDVSDYAASPIGGSLRAVELPVAPRILSGANVPLVRFDLAASVRAVTYDSITITLVGTAPVTAVSGLRLVDGGGGDLGTRIPVSPQVTFTFPARTLNAGQTDRLFVFADVVGTSGNTLGARLAGARDLAAGTAAVHLDRAPSDASAGYLGTVPTSVVIDGGFAEWTVNATDTTGGVPAHVDLAEYAYYLNAQRASAYLKLAGRALGGSLVPAANSEVPSPGPGPGATDADRDSVPDASDSFPNDFDNDGVPDSSTPSDYDGDGITDYPAGPDLYLNTTIPGTFPPPYANRPVSVFIGPNAVPPEYGEDVARVFFDADNDTATGFRVDAIGADYLAEVRGKEGIVTARTLSAFAGASQWEWTWNVLESTAAETDYAHIELAFSILARGFTNDSRAYFDVRGWDGQDDSGQGPVVRMDTRGADLPSTRDISGNQKWFFRNTSTTGTGCTSNFAASTSAGAALASTTLSVGQTICWFTPLDQPDTITGIWEVILDIDKASDGTNVFSPDANGDTNAWTASGCTEANEYQCVDEDPKDDDTTYIVSTSSSVLDSLFNIPDWSSPPSPLTIVSVVVEASCRRVSGGVKLSILVKSGGTTSGSPETACAASYTLYTNTWTTDPSDGLAWTLADINALQVGVRDNDGGSQELRVSHVKATVSWNPIYSVQIDKCLNEACSSLTTLYGPTSGNTFGNDVTFTTGSIAGQTLGSAERIRFKVELLNGGTVTLRYNGANPSPGTDDSRATVPIPEFGEVLVPMGVVVVIVVVRAARGRRRREVLA